MSFRLRDLSLTAKAIVPLVAILALFGVVSFFFYSYQITKELHRVMEASTRLLAGTVSEALNIGMVKNDRERVTRAIEQLVRNEEALLGVDILNEKATIRLSSSPARVDMAGYDDELEELRKGRNFLYQYRKDEKGRRFATGIVPFRSTADCQSCHPGADRFLGALVLSVDLENDLATVRYFQIAEAVRNVLIVLVITLLFFLILRFVIVRPLARVTGALATLAETGDLSAARSRSARATRSGSLAPPTTGSSTS